MSQGAWGRASLVSVGVCAIGYALFKLTTPSDKELYDVHPSPTNFNALR